MTTMSIDLLQILRILFFIGFTFAAFLFFIFSWVGIRRVNLLNRMVQTPLAKALTGISFLFLVFSIGTLIVMLLLWIVPLF